MSEQVEKLQITNSACATEYRTVYILGRFADAHNSGSLRVCNQAYMSLTAAFKLLSERPVLTIGCDYLDSTYIVTSYSTKTGVHFFSISICSVIGRQLVSTDE